jgi:Conserved hypothetical protein (Lin0512_fam).
MIEAVPGGRQNMLIQVKLGVPAKEEGNFNDGMEPLHVDLSHVAKVFPYGKLLPIQVVLGGLSFPTGRIVRELGDQNDTAVCVAASVAIGYDNGKERSHNNNNNIKHATYDTADGF